MSGRKKAITDYKSFYQSGKSVMENVWYSPRLLADPGFTNGARSKHRRRWEG